MRGPVKVASSEGFETNVASSVPVQPVPPGIRRDRACARPSRQGGRWLPAYNIERLPRDGQNPERLRITLAVAGFTRDQLDVSVEESQLVIRGRQQDDKARQYLHRGIAARQFQRTFVLADGME